MKYLIQFAQRFESFRLPELKSCAKLAGLEYTIVWPLSPSSDPTNGSPSPFVVVTIDKVDPSRHSTPHEAALEWVSRAVLVKSISEYWAQSQSLESLHALLQAPFTSETLPLHALWKSPLYQSKRFKFHISGFGKTLSIADQRAIVESFGFFGWKGKVDLQNPELVISYFEDYGEKNAGMKQREQPLQVFIGLLMGSGNRSIVSNYDLKKRSYLGTTSMDAELSLIMANQALITPAKLVLDPFVGTGSLLVGCAHFGAMTMGGDIDGRQIRGTSNNNLETNLDQYKLISRFWGNFVCDIAHHPWREQSWFDAIVCDPPYGVRAGAKKIAPVPEGEVGMPPMKPNGEMRYPNTVPYDVQDVIQDLVNFAARYLVIGGRLVFWLPTWNEEYSHADIPDHAEMKLVANSEQCFGKWSRRLITMVRTSSNSELEKGVSSLSLDASKQSSSVSHSQFREKYFRKE